MPTLHLLTIGQAPREDLTPEIAGWIGDREGFEIREAGALDGLSPAEIARAAEAVDEAANDEPPLVSRLRDGTEVVVPQRFVEGRLVRLAEAVPPGDLGAILCTGRFPEAPARIVRADAAFDRALARLAAPGAVVGVLAPHERQLEDARGRVPRGRRALAAAWSPYGPPETRRSSLLAVVERRFSGAALIGLNCLGYTGTDAAAIEDACGTPVVLARRALAEVIRTRLAGTRGAAPAADRPARVG